MQFLGTRPTLNHDTLQKLTINDDTMRETHQDPFPRARGSRPWYVPPSSSSPHNSWSSQAIDQAMRTHCGIPGKLYFVAVLTEDGRTNTFSTFGNKLDDSTVGTFFDSQRFQQFARNALSSK